MFSIKKSKKQNPHATHIEKTSWKSLIINSLDNIQYYYQFHCADSFEWEQNLNWIELNDDTVVFCRAALKLNQIHFCKSDNQAEADDELKCEVFIKTKGEEQMYTQEYQTQAKTKRGSIKLTSLTIKMNINMSEIRQRMSVCWV